MAHTSWVPWKHQARKQRDKKTEKTRAPSDEEQRNGGATREETRRLLAQTGVDEGPIETVPDVLLDVPTVKVDEISLDVESLHARVALHAELANLVKLDVGAEVDIDRVELTIQGVEAQALLKVRLQRVYEILNRALQTVDDHPDLLASLLKPLGHAVSEVGDAAHETLRPGGAVSEVAHDVGDTAKTALGPGGTLTRVAGDVGDAAKQTLGPGGAVNDAVKGTVGPEGVVSNVGRTVDRALPQGAGRGRSSARAQGHRPATPSRRKQGKRGHTAPRATKRRASKRSRQPRH
ncbi:hypothetical protein LY474_35670 [Myxococcus stipitatus]|uniref:hypothetical protein n=1 Tax=Myxococcus stipitatus TaxID=83455 RepID=UPI001F295278|nr:hypothetical protein [Myxococcus stipitatus]MCE9673159.1 hypothetical protein [Myxococcus stipitatus]